MSSGPPRPGMGRATAHAAAHPAARVRARIGARVAGCLVALCPERGAGAVSTAIIAPVVFLLTFGMVQGALYWQAHNLATAAAQTGVEAARVDGGSTADGERVAAGYLAVAGGHLTSGAVITGSRGGGIASITVRLPAPSLVAIPVLPQVVGTASAPVERVTTP